MCCWIILWWWRRASRITGPGLYHVPAQGDAVPDFKLKNQDGHAIHLGQFKGKSLLVTFIYTRCPRPDFCPRVTRNFAVLEKQIAATPALHGTHLLCVSFDPDNDTPERLRAYGAHLYRQRRERARLPIGILPCRRSRC
jgi:cytochrome oxidase Cu insertion factor (SCO1/SenC/PrrC family)